MTVEKGKTMNISPISINFAGNDGKCKEKGCEDRHIVDGAYITGPIEENPYPYNGTVFPDGSYFDSNRKLIVPEKEGKKLDVEA